MKRIIIVLCLTSIFADVLHNVKAETSCNEHRMIKTFINKIKVALDTDRDSLPNLIREMESLAKTVTDTASVAVFHSMTAEMYHCYYLQNRRAIARRTPVEGFIPEDIREWTHNLFEQKIKEELTASLLPVETLRQTPVSLFDNALEKGKDSPALRPTLYDFLAHRALELQPSEAIYRDLLSFRRSQPNPQALLAVELDYMQYVCSLYREEKVYEASLDSLLKVHDGQDYSVEVAYAKLELLQEKRGGQETWDSIRTIEYQLCREMLARYPRYDQIEIVENWLASLEEKELRVISNRTAYPGKCIEIKLYYTNIREATIRVYEETETSPGKLTEEISVSLSLQNSYATHDTIICIPTKKLGRYEYVVTSSETPLRVANKFGVSRLAVISRPASFGEQIDVLVTDYLSGKPIQGATVYYYGGTTQTDRNGLAFIPAGEEVRACRVRLAEDEVQAVLNVYAAHGWTDWKAQAQVSLFTDRGVYRPGQTLFFKGIAYTGNKENPQIAPGERIEVILRDADYKEIATQSFTTNAFGSFSGEFTLPAKTLTGRFTLSAANFSASIQVEEYKRPTFRIDIPAVKEDISFGDETIIRGKVQTFAGVSLTNGVVAYRIVQRPFFFRPYYGAALEKQVAGGETSTDGDGNFSFAFRPEKDDTHTPFARQSYEITIQVTDGKGETQEARTAFSVGDQSLILSVNLPDRVNKDTASIRIAAHTLNGESVSVQGVYSIFILEESQTEGSYAEGQKVLDGLFATAPSSSRIILSGLPSGRMRLRLSTTDSKGRQVNEQQDFILYSPSDKRPPVFSPAWLPAYKTEYLPGEEASVCFGTSHKKVYLLYELFSNGQTLARRRVKLGNENVTFRIPFLHSYADGLVASFTFIKDGQLHTQQVTLAYKHPDKTLTVKPETFRDKLLPGSRESLKFLISDAQARPVSAEVLAGMYDASLDPIYPFAWRFSLPAAPLPHHNRFVASEGLGVEHDSDIAAADRVQTPSYAFDRLDWQGALDIPATHRFPYLLNKGEMTLATSAVNKQMEEVSEDNIFALPVPDASLPERPSPAPFPLRSDFNETAFFFPALHTDREGNVALNFSLPESHTTWKLQILAHTADLKYGLSSHKLITQKPFMALPNLPRFIRQGDEVHLTAQIINLSAEETSGNTRLEVFNPATGELILPANTQPFMLPAGGTTTVGWPVALPDDAESAGIRITADSETGSDGEQHILPVLPDKVLLTESFPFYLADEEEKQVTVAVKQVSPTLHPYRMTLEFSNNPVWYAVQSLSDIPDPDNDDVVSLFASYYSRTLSAYIVRSNPRIKHAIKFDFNRTSYQRDIAMRELLRQQHQEGGWGWFEGFRPSRSITLYILEGMAQLASLNDAPDPQEKEMQIKAIQYLDKAIREDYDKLRKSGVSLHNYLPNPQQVQYLYVRSAYRDIPEAGETHDAIRYYTEQVEKLWQKLALYEKGETALLMHRNENKKVAGDILNLLRKTAVTSPEKGMYWPNNRREQNFFLSPTDVHCLLMTVFRELGASATETERQKQWLLNRKQAQNRESAPSAANALYSLLSNGSDPTAETNETTIRWGDKTFHASAQKTDAGYLKESVSGKDLAPALYTVTVHKKGKLPAWGAIFYQYYESIGKINKQGGALSVEKKLFVETNNGVQRQITPVDADRPLKVGDKVIVRLTIIAKTKCSKGKNETFPIMYKI
ncbi:MAG: alpha-2-macroglobulin [Tannerellaceae bacterium]|jgi:hypothetical protein|nr:alpha-2-macroglobulin [Tannerellaceae bacterium]